MLPSHKGSIRLFRCLGIDVWLHWSWFLVAVIQIQFRAGLYSSYIWCVIEYLALFVIVLLHEFGHSLACRSVGGRADQIVLWPLGGVAFVDPPPRPGATLWSLAAGPLVNVLLFPIFSVGWLLALHVQLQFTMPNFYQLVKDLWVINLILVCFNLLPIYPLDGGQILRSLLWYVVGRARSLMIASTIGLIAVALLLLFAIRTPWLGVMAAFALIQCWSGLQHARQLARIEDAPRHAGLACPSCGRAPPVGEFWVCSRCRRRFDTFATQAFCPHCGVRYNVTGCVECGKMHPIQSYAQV
jgi:Zn-dependent protease